MPYAHQIPPRKPDRRSLAGGLASAPVVVPKTVPGIVPRADFPQPGPGAGWWRWGQEMLGEKFNAPALAQYPTSEQGRAFGASAAYGRGFEGFLQPGTHAPFAADVDDEPEIGRPEDASVEDLMRRAALAVSRDPIASLGFEPRVMKFWKVPREKTGLAGYYRSESDTIGANQEFPEVAIHESMHRGIEKLRKLGLYPSELDGIKEELVVRRMMQTMMGNPEEGSGEAGDEQIWQATQRFERSDRAERFQKGLNKLQSAAAQLIAKQRSRGPK